MIFPSSSRMSERCRIAFPEDSQDPSIISIMLVFVAGIHVSCTWQMFDVLLPDLDVYVTVFSSSYNQITRDIEPKRRS